MESINKRKYNFIYDDTSDLHRAIAMSDAYFGDGSSVVQLYQNTGKPILVQSPLVLDKNTWLMIGAVCVFDDCLYFTIWGKTLLFKKELSKNTIEFVCNLQPENMISMIPFSTATEYNGKIYFSPVSPDISCISAFEPSTNIVSKIPLKAGGYRKTHKIDDILYFVGFYESNIICLDKNETVTYYDIPAKNKDGVYFWDSCIAGKYIAAVSYCDDTVVLFNTEEKTHKTYYLKNDITGFDGICYCNGNFWIALRSLKYVVKWNPFDNIFEKYDNFPDGFVRGSYAVYGMVASEQYVWLLPCEESNMLLRIDVYTGEIECAKKYDTPIIGGRYSDFYDIGDCVYAAETIAGKYICIKKATTEIIETEFDVDVGNISESVFELNFYSDENISRIHHEGGLITQNLFSDAVRIQEKKCTNDKTKSAGSAIYEFIKKQVLNS